MSEPLALSLGQQFELERMSRAIDATVDPQALRGLAKQLLQAWHSQKAATPASQPTWRWIPPPSTPCCPKGAQVLKPPERRPASQLSNHTTSPGSCLTGRTPGFLTIHHAIAPLHSRMGYHSA